VRSKPWQCREGLKWNFEKSEDETMIASRGSQKWILKEVRWVHECMNVCNIFHFFYSYFYFFFVKDACLQWECLNIYIESYEGMRMYVWNTYFPFLFIEWMMHIWNFLFLLNEWLYENAYMNFYMKTPVLRWYL